MEQQLELPFGTECRVVPADALGLATQEGWELIRVLEEEGYETVSEEIPNPDYDPKKKDDYYQVETPTLRIDKTVPVKKHVFLMKMTKDNPLLPLKKLLEEKEDELLAVTAELKETLEKYVEAQEKINSDVEGWRRKFEDLQKGAATLEEANATMVAREKLLLDIFSHLWAQFGNLKMRQVLGARYRDEFDSMNAQSQAKSVYDHLLDE